MKYLLTTALLATSSSAYSVYSGKSDSFATVAKDKLQQIGMQPNMFDHHGCWASRLLGGYTEDYLNAPSPRLDDVDGHIRDWHAARRCIQMPGGNCAGGIDAETYSYKTNNNVGCGDETDSCLNALCLIDHYYATAVEDAVYDGPWGIIDPTATACNSTEQARQCDYCSGLAPENLSCGELPQPSAECAGKAVDIWLSVDGSGSVKLNNFNKMRAHIVSFLENLDIAADKMHVGVSQWAKSTRVEFNFESDKIQVLSEVGPMQYMDELCSTCTRTGKGLNHAYNQIMANKRDNVPQILVTFTDGKAHDDGTGSMSNAVTPAMNKIKAANIKAFAIGIGAKTQQSQLDKFITNDGQAWRLAGDDAFDDLGDIINEVAATVCGPANP